MSKYGIDKPDLRYGMEIQDLNEIFKNTDFTAFSEVIASGGKIGAIKTEQPEKFSRKNIDDLEIYIKSFGLERMAYIRFKDDNQIQSSIAKYINDEEISALKDKVQAKPGDLLFVVAGNTDTVNEALGMLRIKLANTLKIIPEGEYNFLWVTNFPLFEYSKTEKRYSSMHHPFTAPVDEDIPMLESNPFQARSKAYDLVLNGNEVGGGSIRIHRTELQQKIFDLLGINEIEAKQKFGFLLEALQYGAPPHGGIAFGMDRLTMILANATSIREVIAFPKTQRATCMLTGAPAEVSPEQLKGTLENRPLK